MCGIYACPECHTVIYTNDTTYINERKQKKIWFEKVFIFLEILLKLELWDACEHQNIKTKKDIENSYPFLSASACICAIL